eukprot:Phypoly_transcript_06540.p1 GENE.Phypoly_transcript_06540~~Phypoly_transcript_06540.p1  ORF type:complete len:519 (-),score=154.20 Phypoly_transcript_06540:218-1735(-)
MAELVAPSPSSSSRALVVPEPLNKKPRVRPKETVLEEDTYIDALQTIIQRDFFPDLPKLEAQLEWMEAEKANDVDKMRELQQRMLSSRRPTTGRATPARRTPRATPKGFETPSGGPTATPNLAQGGATPASGSSASAPASSEPASDAAPKGLNLNLSLDKFIEKHTSEDDASFVTIMDRQHDKHVEKYGWVEEKSTEAAKMLIEASKKDENGHFPALQTWNYTVRNQLMYVPDGEDASLMPPPPPGPPKEILHRNTRIVAQPNQAAAAAVRKGDQEAIWSMMAANDRQLLNMRKAEREGGKVDLLDLLGTPKTAASPQVRGYGFVATPSPAPGVDMSPMTTWGRLDGTPLLIDPTDTPLDLTPGPSFKVPEPPRREALAMRLADKAKESQKAKARAYAASPYARPSAALSPAGRSLMESKLSSKRSSVGADMQLRASYTSPALGGKSPAQRKGGFVTPSPLPSPTPSPSRTKAPTPSHASSITDNLLDTPAASKKGKSITDDLLI